MSKITEYITSLKNKREELKKKQKEVNEKRASLDTIQFYEDSKQLDSVMDGLSIVIADNSSLRAKATKGYTHLQAVREILRLLDITDYFEPSEGDFGQEVADKYHSIFIRATSVDLGPTIVYYPEKCTDFQISQLKKFNEEIKSYNLNPNHKKNDLIWFCYEVNGEECKKDNLDELIQIIESKKRSTKTA